MHICIVHSGGNKLNDIEAFIAATKANAALQELANGRFDVPQDAGQHPAHDWRWRATVGPIMAMPCLAAVYTALFPFD